MLHSYLWKNNKLIIVIICCFCFINLKAATYVVSSSADSGAGTLREAITLANGNPGADVINFNLGGSSVITLSSGLPDITDEVLIDGFSENGAALNSLKTGTPHVILIEINGNAVSDYGFDINGTGNVTVRGLAMNGFGNDVIRVLNSTAPVTIEGVYFNLDASGTTTFANTAEHAVFISGSNDVTINESVLSNSRDGIFVNNGSTGMNITNNIIGLAADGVTAMGNDRNGINLAGAGTGSAIIQGNVISSNANDGIVAGASSGGSNQVRNNCIGTDLTGANNLGNGRHGVFFQADVNFNIIDGNVISNSAEEGIAMFGSSNNAVSNNMIGTDITGTICLGNLLHGIVIRDLAHDINISNNNVSCNGQGIHVSGGGDHSVGSNIIGTDAAGTMDLGNLTGGVFVCEGTNVNILSNTVGNSDDRCGITIHATAGDVVDNIIINNNFVGTNSTETSNIGNGGGGICIKENGFPEPCISISDNVVANNLSPNDLSDPANDYPGSGIWVGSVESVCISQNSTYNNAQIGIDLSVDNTDISGAVDLNDTGDSDTGGNLRYNFPVIQSATIVDDSLEVCGWAQSGDLLEFFIADGDASGFGEGRTYLFNFTEGSADDSNSSVSSYSNTSGSDNTNEFCYKIACSALATPLAGVNITATASATGTNCNCNTSEFAQAVAVTGTHCTAPTAPALSVTDNVCPSTTGTINIDTPCVAGSHIEYSTDGGVNWSTTQPTYGTSSITILSRCVDDIDPTCFSTSDSDSTNPTDCGSPPPTGDCDCHDYVYLNDTNLGEVHKFQVQEDGSLIEIGSPWYSGVTSPHGIGMDLNGFVYIGEVTNPPVYNKLTCDGDLVSNTILSNSITNGTFEQYFHNTIHVGNLMVRNNGSKLEMFDICADSKIGEVMLQGVTWGVGQGEDGMIYATTSIFNVWGTANVYRLPFDDTYFATNPTPTPIFTHTLQSDFRPYGIDSDINGNIYIRSTRQDLTGDSRVYKFDSSGNVLNFIDDTTNDGTGFNNGWGLVYSPSADKLYLSDYWEDCVAVLDANTLTYETTLSVPGAGGKGIGVVTECCPTITPLQSETYFCSIPTNNKINLADYAPCQGLCANASLTGGWNQTSGTTMPIDPCDLSILLTGEACFSFSGGGTGGNAICSPYEISVCFYITNPPPPALSVTDNVCPSTTGSINIDTPCTTGSHIEYSYDNGATWGTVLGPYGTSSVTILSRCVDDNDPACFSSNDSDTTNPQLCTAPCIPITCDCVDPDPTTFPRVCDDGSDSHTLTGADASTQWFNEAGTLVATGSTYSVTSNSPGMEDGSETYRYTFTDSEGCPQSSCCDVPVLTQNCNSPCNNPQCTQNNEFFLCSNGTDSIDLVADAGLTNIEWFDGDGNSLGTNPTITLINTDIINGIAGDSQCFYYTAQDSNSCDGYTCCPVIVTVENCCPDNNCFGLQITPN